MVDILICLSRNRHPSDRVGFKLLAKKAHEQSKNIILDLISLRSNVLNLVYNNFLGFSEHSQNSIP